MGKEFLISEKSRIGFPIAVRVQCGSENWRAVRAVLQVCVSRRCLHWPGAMRSQTVSHGSKNVEDCIFHSQDVLAIKTAVDSAVSSTGRTTGVAVTTEVDLKGLCSNLMIWAGDLVGHTECESIHCMFPMSSPLKSRVTAHTLFRLPMLLFHSQVSAASVVQLSAYHCRPQWPKQSMSSIQVVEMWVEWACVILLDVGRSCCVCVCVVRRPYEFQFCICSRTLPIVAARCRRPSTNIKNAATHVSMILTI